MLVITSAMYIFHLKCPESREINSHEQVWAALKFIFAILS